jgi:hypothetical protein
VGLVRNDGSNTASPRRFAIGLAGLAFVADDGARLNVRSYIEQDVEMTRVGGLTPWRIAALPLSGQPRFQRYLGLRGVITPEELKAFPTKGADAAPAPDKRMLANSVASIERT